MLCLLHVQFESGFVTLNEHRHAMFVLEDDPAARRTPLVGVYATNVASVHDPRVFMACMRFMAAGHLQDRVFLQQQYFVLCLHTAVGDTVQWQWFELCALADDVLEVNQCLATHQTTIKVCVCV